MSAKRTFSTLGTSISKVRDDLDELRDHVAGLKASMADIESRPDDPATIEKRIDAAVEAALAENPLHFPGMVRPDASDVGLRGFFVRAMENPLGVFAALASDTLKKVLTANMPRDGITPQERASMLGKVKDDLLAAECAEEVLCRELDAALGVDVPRRADAPAAILLAPDDQLSSR